MEGEKRWTCKSRGVLNDDLIIRVSWAGKRRTREMAERSLEILSSKQEYRALPLLVMCYAPKSKWRTYKRCLLG